ncbi:MAG: T9SS type A sorting domain-containing protein [Bacteroidia bacterium]|nr:T9SS type A sorting domain-containing protein [Bacteroidia bacterium]
MKGLSIIVISLIFAFSANAQSISVTNHYQNFWGNVFDEMGGVSLDVTNNGASDIVLQAIRSANFLASGHESYFCYGIRCYDSTVDTADQYVSVPSGQTVPSTLIHYLKPLGNAGISEVHYCLVDTANPSDSICFKFIYNASATGIFENADNELIKVFPNPASKDVMLDIPTNFTNDQIVQVIGLDGRVILEHKLNGNMNPIIDVSAIINGIYFLRIKGEIYYAKLSVQH